MLSLLRRKYLEIDVTTVSGRSLVEEHYRSVRRQTPIVYLLGFVNLAAMEVAATGTFSLGFNVPTFVVACGLLRMWHWYGSAKGSSPSHRLMIRRLRQTIVFAFILCVAVCAHCLHLLQVGDAESDMAILLFGGLTALGVAYGLTTLPAARWIPLILIIGPLSVAAFLSDDRRFEAAAFGLVAVALLTLQLLGAHSRHFARVIRSHSLVVREQEKVEHARQEALVAATTDFLTGLPNRRAFVGALESASAESRGGFAVAILDLDRFKAVNDTFGHAVGDQVLKEVTARLVRQVGDSGIVARLAGDEFGVLLSGVSRPGQALAIGSRILAGVNGRTRVGEREFAIAASCGMALARKCDDHSPSRVMADADLALYDAKDGAGGGVALFRLEMEAPRRRRAQIEHALQMPEVHQHLRVVFQPILDLRTGRIVANEALARWTDPELGEVAPSEFVPIAEQLSRIDDINRHLMQLAFEAARSWREDIRLSFNLSAVQLCSPGCANAVLHELRRAALSAKRLQVEVTETALLADFERARASLDQMRKSGVRIVLDDFGAGYASINYLRELRFDQIKLDGGLVTAAKHSADGKRLLRAVVGLCDILGVSTVAEHVESSDLLGLVKELGCTAGQGFWLERPMGEQELLELLRGKVIPLRRQPRRRAA